MLGMIILGLAWVIGIYIESLVMVLCLEYHVWYVNDALYCLGSLKTWWKCQKLVALCYWYGA